MKKAISTYLLLFSQIAFAFAPVNMGIEAKTLARVLLNPQVTSCVAEFNEHEISVSHVIVQDLDSHHSRFRVEGIVLQGGMAVTQRTLEIEETVQDDAWFGRAMTYTCKVLADPSK